MFTSSSRPHQREERETFLTEQGAYHCIQELGYTPVVRFHHLHAIRLVDRVGSFQEDERHLCQMDALPTMVPSQLVLLLHDVFRHEGYSR